MKDLNSLIVKGRLTREPSVNMTNGGDSVCHFSIANNRGKTKEGQELSANFFNVECWNKLADNVAKYVAKGQAVIVSGELRFKKWDDKDGVTRYDTYIGAREIDFLFLDQKGDSGNGSVPDQVREAFDGEEVPS